MNSFISKTILLIFMGATSFLFLFILAHQAQAADVTLSWERPDDSRVTGYYIYYGPEKIFNSLTRIKINDPTINSCVIPDLTELGTYCFVAESFDADGNTSDFSDTLWYMVPEDKQDKLDRSADIPLNVEVPAPPVLNDVQ